jgi:hypothetical protein
MTKKMKPDDVGSSAKNALPKQPTIDTSDVPDSRPDARLGTLRDAIERAKARRKSAAAGQPAT